MNNLITFFIVLLQASTAPFLLKALEEREEVIVRLSTENELLPLYVPWFESEDASFDPSYKEKLLSVLTFDLNHSGMTRVVDKESSALYRVQGVIKKDKTLLISVTSLNNGTSKKSEALPLACSLSEDRKQVHKLADLIHKTLFNTPGIATTRILYSVKRKGENNSWISEIWESDYDGENARKVLSEAGYHISPVYLPPATGHLSKSFFYISYQTAQPKIYAASLDSKTGFRWIPGLGGNQLTPSVSRQRDKIAFICDITGNPDIFIQDFDPKTGPKGKPRLVFAKPKYTQSSPVFSPDGRKIAFVSNFSGSPRIYVLDIPPAGASINDLKPELITRRCGESTAPCWSPDGTKLAYAGKVDGVRQIWIYDFAKKQERQLTKGAMNKENPSFAPNSLSLVYNSSEQENSELYLINVNMPNAAKISSGKGEKRFPSWEPRP